MKLITFEASEKECPVFLNQPPYPQVGTIYAIERDGNECVGLTLDDKFFQLTGVEVTPRKTRGRKKLLSEVAHGGSE